MLSSLGQCNHGTDFYFAIYQREWSRWWYESSHLFITTLSPNNVTYHVENSTGTIVSSGKVSNDSPATVSSYDLNWPWNSSSLYVYTDDGGLITVLVYYSRPSLIRTSLIRTSIIRTKKKKKGYAL